MRLLLVPSALLLWAGLALLLSELRPFARRPLAERLGPYVPGATGAGTRVGLLSAESFREVVGPLARQVGERLSRLLGVSEDLERRLRRVHADIDTTGFRVRQIGWSLAGVGVGTLLAVATRPPAPIVLLLLVGGLALPFLLLEQRIATASERWQQALRLELPVVAEQVGMLMDAGYPLVGALDRAARRGTGAVARDLRRVLARIRQGAAEEAALREWADLAGVEAVRRLVSVLALNREASDLGRLISDEARAIRRDAQRELVERMERRGQQVWIPVTVAALLPGVVFIIIPFFSAVGQFLQ